LPNLKLKLKSFATVHHIKIFGKIFTDEYVFKCKRRSEGRCSRHEELEVYKVHSFYSVFCLTDCDIYYSSLLFSGMGLGKLNQGRTDIIETESRVSTAGLGSKHSSVGSAGDDYKTYIKKMMKSRYDSAHVND
jgi:hypothetical protein